jgi:branched-chain amino acid transport system permease protein
LIGLPSLRSQRPALYHHHVLFLRPAEYAIINGGSFTGGATGLDVGSIDKIFGINFDQLRNSYYLVIAFLLLCLLVTYLIVNSSYGRTLRAIREERTAPGRVGINANRHRIGVLMVSGAFAGVAGILRPIICGTFRPDSTAPSPAFISP